MRRARAAQYRMLTTDDRRLGGGLLYAGDRRCDFTDRGRNDFPNLIRERGGTPMIGSQIIKPSHRCHRASLAGHTSGTGERWEPSPLRQLRLSAAPRMERAAATATEPRSRRSALLEAKDAAGRRPPWRAVLRTLGIGSAGSATADWRCRGVRCAACHHLVMARMFPDRLPGNASPSEKPPYRALEQLADPWRVFHSVAWQSLRKGRQGDGEADFVPIHHRHGLIVIEAKGGSIHI